MPAIVTVTTLLLVVVTNYWVSSADRRPEEDVLPILSALCSRDSARIWNSRNLRILSLLPR